MRWSETSENQWMILKKKEQPTLQVAEVQFRQTWWTWVSKEKSHKAQNSAPGLHLCILGTDWLSSLAETELQITDCQVEWEPRVCSHHEGKVKKSGIKGNSHCSFTSIKYWVLFQTSQVEKEWESLERVTKWPGALRVMSENHGMELGLFSLTKM